MSIAPVTITLKEKNSDGNPRAMQLYINPSSIHVIVVEDGKIRMLLNEFNPDFMNREFISHDDNPHNAACNIMAGKGAILQETTANIRSGDNE